MPEDISNGILWNTDKLFYINLSKESRPNSNFLNSLYFSTCYTKIQNEIDQAYIKLLSNETQFSKLEVLRSFPIPDVVIDDFIHFVADKIPLLFTCFLVYSVFVLIKVRIMKF